MLTKHRVSADIYRGEGPTDIRCARVQCGKKRYPAHSISLMLDRWIPYDESDFDSTPVTLEDVLDPPLEKLVNAPPSFNTWIRDAPDLENAPELAFMRGRTVVMAGDRCVEVPSVRKCSARINQVRCGSQTATTDETLRVSVRIMRLLEASLPRKADMLRRAVTCRCV